MIQESVKTLESSNSSKIIAKHYKTINLLKNNRDD